MWNFAKKLAFAGVTSLLAATASLSAAIGDCCDYNNCYNNDSFCCGDWSIEAEALLWRTNVDELPVGRSFHSCANPAQAVALPNDGTISVIPSTCTKYYTKYLDFDWRPGARVTLGYKSPCSCWDLDFIWTWLHSDASTHLSDRAPGDNPYQSIEGAWTSGATPPFDPTNASPVLDERIHADWGLQYNTFELGFGYTFCACCDQFVVRPHFDVKVALIRQRFTFSHDYYYQGFETTTPNVYLPFLYVDQVRVSRDYTGVGPQIGLDFKYHVCGGFGVYGKAAAALLFAEPEIKFRGKVKTEAAIPELAYDGNVDTRSRTDPRHVNFNSTLGAGIYYSKWVCDCCYRLTFKLGWEHHFYTDQNQIHRATFTAVNQQSSGIRDIFFPVENGNLSLYGLTASIGLDY